MGNRTVGILLSISGLVVMAGVGCGQTDEPIGGLDCGPGTVEEDGHCVPDGASGGSTANGGASAQGEAGGGSSQLRECPTDLPGPEMVLIEVPDGRTFCIDSTEVTQRQYAEFLDANPEGPNLSGDCAGNITLNSLDEDFSRASSLRVIDVDWCDAYQYCEWAGKHLCGAIGGGAGTLDTVNDPLVSEWYAACSAGGTIDAPYTSDEWRECSNNNQTPCEGAVPGTYDLLSQCFEFTNECPEEETDKYLCVRRGWVGEGDYNLGCAIEHFFESGCASFRCCF